MKNKIQFISLIAMGFVAPYIFCLFKPNSIYPGIVSMLFFWGGFICLLKNPSRKNGLAPYMGWSLISIGFMAIMNFLVWVLNFMVTTFEASIGWTLIKTMALISNPFGTLLSSLFSTQVVTSDGTIIGSYNQFWVVFLGFLSVVFYVALAVLLKFIVSKVKPEFS